ncbi:PWI domain-containing protein [Sphaceloma murrayae]|uniref:PWI domain-containing protein n=1 Tax=Sphaceloma murrayae TaxID=2082308 RepID=A0A2K1QHX0_9PEZI|nr:PWI domain-containing protein [Sphaceloma murrayae]
MGKKARKSTRSQNHTWDNTNSPAWIGLDDSPEGVATQPSEETSMAANADEIATEKEADEGVKAKSGKTIIPARASGKKPAIEQKPTSLLDCCLERLKNAKVGETAKQKREREERIEEAKEATKAFIGDVL